MYVLVDPSGYSLLGPKAYRRLEKQGHEILTTQQCMDDFEKEIAQEAKANVHGRPGYLFKQHSLDRQIQEIESGETKTGMQPDLGTYDELKRRVHDRLAVELLCNVERYGRLELKLNGNAARIKKRVNKIKRNHGQLLDELGYTIEVKNKAIVVTPPPNHTPLEDILQVMKCGQLSKENDHQVSFEGNMTDSGFLIGELFVPTQDVNRIIEITDVESIKHEISEDYWMTLRDQLRDRNNLLIQNDFFKAYRSSTILENYVVNTPNTHYSYQILTSAHIASKIPKKQRERNARQLLISNEERLGVRLPDPLFQRMVRGAVALRKNKEYDGSAHTSIISAASRYVDVVILSTNKSMEQLTQIYNSLHGANFQFCDNARYLNRITYSRS